MNYDNYDDYSDHFDQFFADIKEQQMLAKKFQAAIFLVRASIEGEFEMGWCPEAEEVIVW